MYFVTTGRRHALSILVKYLKWENEGKEGSVLTGLEPTLVIPVVCLGWLSYDLQIGCLSLWRTYDCPFLAQRDCWLTHLVSMAKWQMGVWLCKNTPVVWNATKILNGMNYYFEFDKKSLLFNTDFTCKELLTMIFMKPIGRSIWIGNGKWWGFLFVFCY